MCQEDCYNMGQTKHQQVKARRIKAKQRRIHKQHNIQINTANRRFRLEVCVDGNWKTVREWSKIEQVEAHRIETESLRAKGETILGGRVYDMKFGKLILEIPASRS